MKIKIALGRFFMEMDGKSCDFTQAGPDSRSLFFFVSPEKKLRRDWKYSQFAFQKSSSPLQYRESDKLEKEADNCDYDQDNRLVLMVVLPMPGSLP